MLETYVVGGAVRDYLKGLTPKDKDHVVIGSSEEEMLSMGFIQVGSSFPIFLHPETKEEYVLADKLETDLIRRDLTINAMAMTEQGEILDPFGGKSDLEKKILRHVSSAFAEDALRVYRVARFKALYPEYTLAPETLNLMQELVKGVVFQILPGERVFSELRKALDGEKPSLFFEVLKELNAMEIHFIELKGINWKKTMTVLDQSSIYSDDLIVKYAILLNELKEVQTLSLSLRLKVPNTWIEAAITVNRYLLKLRTMEAIPAEEIVDLFYSMDAFRKPYLVNLLITVASAFQFEQVRLLEDYLKSIRSIILPETEKLLEGKQIGVAIRGQRIRKLTEYINNPNRKN